MVTDTKQGKAELEERDFQVRNILIKEMTQMTAEQLEHADDLNEIFRGKVEQLMSKGHILEVHIVEKVIQ